MPVHTLAALLVGFPMFTPAPSAHPGRDRQKGPLDMICSRVFSCTGEGRGTAGEVLAPPLVSVNIPGLVVRVFAGLFLSASGDSVKAHPLSQGHLVLCEM